MIGGPDRMRTWDRLSATFVKGLKRPGKFYDGGGLMLEATATKVKGNVNKSWIFRYQLDKRDHAMGLGSARVVSLAEARAKAHEQRRLLANGIDPIAHRKAERAAARARELHTATFRQCCEGFLISHGDSWRGKHATQWQNSIRTYCRPIEQVVVADVDTGMVLRCIEAEWKRAPETMDRVRSRIGEVLAWAQVRGLRPPGELPTRWRGHLDALLPHKRSLKPIVHHPAMPYADVPALVQKLIKSDYPIDLCLAFLILTATRSAEARGALWSEIDLSKKIWTVPPARMKRSKEHRVPLSVEALALLKRLPRHGEFVFGNGCGPVAMSLRKALARYAGAGHTVHGFRSAFRDWAGECTAFPREILELSLAHAVGSAVEAAYARSDLIEKRRALMQQWARFLFAPPAGGKVVPMGRRRD
jgi:integrase